jgi:CelD/BcsL family acetyltransferase involved in cellulose biosynthesis
MAVIIIDPLCNALWNELIESHPLASLFHSVEWLRSLATTYEFEIKAVIKTDKQGHAIAGIHYCSFDDERGKRIVSLPFSDFSDALVQSLDEWDELIALLLTENCPIITRQLHNTIPLLDESFVLTSRAKWHGIDLQPDLDMLWTGLHESARRAIRKSQRMGVKVRLAESTELRTFYKLHLMVRKVKYGLLAQPYAFFENICKNFLESNQGLIFFAEYEGKVIGSLFFLAWKDVFTYKFSASHQDELEFRPTDILLWEAIQYGKAQGFRMLDLGLSDWEQEGLIRFKRKYSSEEKTVSFLHYTPPGYIAPEPCSNQLLSPLTELFTRSDVPDEVTEAAGNLLYRFFT